MELIGFMRRGTVKNGIAASLLWLLTGCTTLPLPPTTDSPASPLPGAAVMAPATPATPAAAPRSRIADFIDRRLRARAETPAAVAETAPAAPATPETPEAPVDEKYRLTGEAARELERGHASWYGGQFHGRRTASGENFNKYALTAAHKTLPFGTIVRVRSLKHGREVEVRINDRGPFAKGRVIDLSQAAAEALGLTATGVAEVSLNVAEALGVVKASRRPARKTGKKPGSPEAQALDARQ